MGVTCDVTGASLSLSLTYLIRSHEHLPKFFFELFIVNTLFPDIQGLN